MRDPVVTQLRRIADALEALVALQAPEEAPTTCPHPEDRRLDFGLTNGQPDWQCRDCGYRTVTAA